MLIGGSFIGQETFVAQQRFLACKSTYALVLGAFASIKLSIAGNSAVALTAN